MKEKTVNFCDEFCKAITGMMTRETAFSACGATVDTVIEAAAVGLAMRDGLSFTEAINGKERKRYRLALIAAMTEIEKDRIEKAKKERNKANERTS